MKKLWNSPPNPHDMLKPDHFDILSATWVLACNDENSIVTYRGLESRLGLSSDFPVRELVKKRRDLFRLGIPPSQLKAWKAEMRQGHQVPVWMQGLPPEMHEMTIEGLSGDDGFRSQFRTGMRAEKSSLDLLKWGLEHINQLRVAQIESSDQSMKSWQLGLVTALAFINIAATIGVALLKK